MLLVEPLLYIALALLGVLLSSARVQLLLRTPRLGLLIFGFSAGFTIFVVSFTTTHPEPSILFPNLPILAVLHRTFIIGTFALLLLTAFLAPSQPPQIVTSS